MWYAKDKEDLICNIRSIVWGLIMRGYPFHWWNGRFFRVCARFALETFEDECFRVVEQARCFVTAQ